MASLEIRNLKIGQGLPKIAVSITGSTRSEIEDIVRGIDLEKVDLVEWRADFFLDIFDRKKLLEVLYFLRKKLPIPIIFTFRSLEEGGERDISIEEYIDINKTVAKSKIIDIIDIEVFKIEKDIKNLIKEIQESGSYVIASNHDFSKTPSKEDMTFKLETMEKTGADILKIALMPKTSGDVLRLLDVSNQMKNRTEKPLVTISMGELGKISRVSGGVFGSSISFAALEKTSAPGQITVDELFNMLEWMKISK